MEVRYQLSNYAASSSKDAYNEDLGFACGMPSNTIPLPFPPRIVLCLLAFDAIEGSALRQAHFKEKSNDGGTGTRFKAFMKPLWILGW